MNTQVLNQIEKQNSRKDLPNFKVGDTIAVDTLIREGERVRTQTFAGLVLAIKGSGNRKTFTLRKISYGVGVEKIIPVNSTNVSKIKVLKDGKVRRSKIYFMRDRVGKLAMKIKPGRPAPVIEHEAEVVDHSELAPEEVITDEPQIENTAATTETTVETPATEEVAEETAATDAA